MVAGDGWLVVSVLIGSGCGRWTSFGQLERVCDDNGWKKERSIGLVFMCRRGKGSGIKSARDEREGHR